MGLACLSQRNSRVDLPKPVFSLVRRDFPTYDPRSCPSAGKASR